MTNTVFILGAGFSRYAGMPLVVELRDQVFNWIERYKDQDARIKSHMYPLPNWPEYPKGKYYAGLECVDTGDGFEELLIRLQTASEDCPVTIQTIHVLRRACAKLLWETQLTCRLPEEYLHFARHSAQSLGVISFNWDLICERALDEMHFPWSYDSNVRTPIIKPHGSINWVNHLQARTGQVIANPPELSPIAEGMTISWERNKPFDDPLFAYDHDDLRHILFPGDPEIPGPEKNEAEHKDAICLWNAAEQLVSQATRVAFIGYSLPTYDLYARKLLRRICQGKQIVVCNPSDEAIKTFKEVFQGEQVLDEPSKFEYSRYAKPLAAG